MPYRRKKDETNLVAKWKLKVKPNYYFHVFLWKDQKSYFSNTPDDVMPNERSLACAALAPNIIEIYEDGSEKEIIRPKLGELHFIKDKWGLNVVSHELMHAMIHRIRMLHPDFKKVLDQEDDYEEDICYEFGHWVDKIYRKLWEINPSGKWRKRKV